MRKYVVTLGTAILLLGLILGACAPAASTPAAPVRETVVVTAPPVVVTSVATAEPQADRVQVYWYIGLGAGAQPAQIPLEKEFAEKYNASQDEIQLIPIIVDNRFARDNLTAQLAADNAPDIVGPVGTAGRAAFPGAWLDIEPLVEQFNYDMSDIDPAFLDFYAVEGKLEGLPFAIFPSAVLVNKSLFDEAGLPYPPQTVGDPYVWPDGTEEEWNFDTVAKLARLLTVDANGNDATSPDFDRDNIVQYGFDMQWNNDPGGRTFGTYFCAHYPVKDGKADIPDCWREGWKWYYDAIMGEQPFYPSQAAITGEALNNNPFASGKVAMGLTHLWYTCCFDNTTVPSWDVAVVPSYNGKITSKMHGDTFAIMAASKHPEEAFKVYTYMLGEGSADLYGIYGGLPARLSQQADFFAGLDEKFAPNEINWQVFIDMIPFLDAPNHELGLPNNIKANDAFARFGTDLRTNPDLDVDARIDELIAELNQIYSEQPTPEPR